MDLTLLSFSIKVFEFEPPPFSQFSVQKKTFWWSKPLCADGVPTVWENKVKLLFMTTYKSSKNGLKRVVVLSEGFIYVQTGKIFHTTKCGLKIGRAVSPQGANSVRSSTVTAKKQNPVCRTKAMQEEKCPPTWGHLSWWKRSASCRRCTCWRGSSALRCHRPGCSSTRSSRPSPQYWRHSPRKHIKYTHMQKHRRTNCRPCAHVVLFQLLRSVGLGHTHSFSWWRAGRGQVTVVLSSLESECSCSAPLTLLTVTADWALKTNFLPLVSGSYKILFGYKAKF